jgi:hypothetical protein
MPGAFPCARTEAAFLAATAAQRRHLDALTVGCSAVIHLAEAARTPACKRRRRALQLAYCAALLLLALALLTSARAARWHGRHREALVAAVRLGAAAAAPLWASTQNGGAASLFQAAATGGWMGRMPMLALCVRAPLHAALTGASFAMTLPGGAAGALRLRGTASLLNAVIVFAFERDSRAHFAADAAAAEGGGSPKAARRSKSE